MEEENIDKEFETSEQLLFSEYCDVKNIMNRSDASAMMHYYLKELHLDIDKLKYIHVTGSKGKGTTCTYIEKALRLHGLKTGLFTSPHIQSICERFQINGKNISKQVYLKHFWIVWNKLQEIKQKTDRPSYITNWPGFFRFLTIMAFKLFLEEQVDVVILEVGMGGRLDCTNVIETPLATEVLGSTYEAIATEKGGIFKKNAPAFVLSQKDEVMRTLEGCAKETQCSITFVSPQSIPSPMRSNLPSTFPPYLLDNFALAESIVECVLNLFSMSLQPELMRQVLITTQVPARAQIVHSHSHTFYIDGAHTPVSIERVCEWFAQCTSSPRILLFYCGKDKKARDLLPFLVNLSFDAIILSMVKNPKPEYTKITLPPIEIQDEGLFSDIMVNDEGCEEWLLYLAKLWRIEEDSQHKKKTPITIVRNVDSALQWIQTQHGVVCCTGSLYLCGDLLNALHWEEK